MGDLYEKLKQLTASQEHWRCHLYFNQSKPDDEPDVIDLCDYLVAISVRNRVQNKDYPPLTNYMFPEQFTGLACLDLLRVEMRLAAIRCGYNIVVRHSTYIKIPGSQRLYELRFGCQRGALYTNKSTTAQPSETTCQQLNATSFELGASTTVATMETAVPSSNQPTKVITYKTNNKPTQRNTVVSKGELNYVNRTRPAKYKTTTKLPLTKEEACPFKISLFLQSDTAHVYPGRWFLGTVQGSKSASDCCMHHHHLPSNPSVAQVPLECMTAEERELARNCSQLHFAGSPTADLLALRNESGVQFRANQLRYLNQKEKDSVSNLSENATSADKLVESFQQRCAYFF